MAGKKPQRHTPADKRLKTNRAPAAPAKAPAPSGGKPKFGSPAWDAKYGIKRGAKKATKGKKASGK